MEKSKPIITHRKEEKKEVSQTIKRRENTIISILLTGDLSIYEIIKQNINMNYLVLKKQQVIIYRQY